MIKGYKFLVNEEEKSRILNLHQNRTRSQYLNISEQDDDIYDAWSYESPSGEDETISGEDEPQTEKKPEDNKVDNEKQESSEKTFSSEDKKNLTFNSTDDDVTPNFTYGENNSPLSYDINYNKTKDGKYGGDIYTIKIWDSEFGYPVLYVYGKPQEGPPDPTEIKFNPNDKEFIKFQDLLNQTKTKEQWDRLISDNLNNKTPSITSSSESTSQTKSSEVKTQFVAPTNHQEGIAQITDKLKKLGYDTSNIGAAVLQYLEKNKPS